MVPPRLQKIYKMVLIGGCGLSDDHDLDDLSEDQEREIWFTEPVTTNYMGKIILTPEGQKIVDILGNVSYEE